jgi:AcrR family transcriptional regulator
MARPPTREHLIVVAERLYAEHGIHAVSLRQIAEAAGQRNPAVVQYHFGNKLGLLRAIVEYRVQPFNDQRRALLAALDAEGRTHDLEGLIRVVLLPFVAPEARESYYARFLDHLTAEGLSRRVFGKLTGIVGTTTMLTTRLQDALTQLPPELRASRVTLAFRFLVSALADHQHELAAQSETAMPFDLFADDLVEIIAGMLRAPAPASAVQELTAAAAPSARQTD